MKTVDRYKALITEFCEECSRFIAVQSRSGDAVEVQAGGHRDSNHGRDIFPRSDLIRTVMYFIECGMRQMVFNESCDFHYMILSRTIYFFVSIRMELDINIFKI